MGEAMAKLVKTVCRDGVTGKGRMMNLSRQVLNIPDDHIPNKDKGLIVTEALCGYPMWASQRGSGVEPQPPPPRSPYRHHDPC